MAYHNIVAITTALIAAYSHFSVKSGSYGVAYVEAEVYALVDAAESGAITEFGCDADIFEGAYVAADVNIFSVGDCSSGIRIDELAFPKLAVNLIVEEVVGAERFDEFVGVDELDIGSDGALCCEELLMLIFVRLGEPELCRCGKGACCDDEGCCCGYCKLFDNFHYGVCEGRGP